MKEYQAIASHPDNDGMWAVEVKGIGWTQGKGLADAREMAADLVANALEIDPSEVIIKLSVSLDDALNDAVTQVKSLRQQRQQLADAEQEALAKAARTLLGAGMRTSDAGELLGVSKQRVSQIAPSSTRKRKTMTKKPMAAT